jgi:adenine C2-methylase RlmN of 23S rRNA A2503 and tRNA A37
VRQPRGLDIYAACGQLKRMTGPGLVTIGEA